MSAQKSICEHCATPFHPKPGNERFCCLGCEHVHRLIHDGGLDQFYDLRAGSRTRPVETLAFEHRDFSWVDPLSQAAESEVAPGEPATMTLSVSGVSCAACVWLIERIFSNQPGALSATTDAATGALTLTWESGQCDFSDFGRELQSFGYELGPPGDTSGEHLDILAKRVGLCAAFAMNAMAFTLPRYLGMPPTFALAGLFELIAAASAVLSMAVGGSYFITRATRALRHGIIHIDLPIALGVSAAFAGSILGWFAGYAPLLYFDFVAIFIFLMLGGRWLQERTLSRNRSRLADRQGVPTQFRPADGSAPQSLELLRPDVAYLIRPGELVPVASKVAREAPFGLGWISGEAESPPIPSGGVAPSGAVYLGDSETELLAREAWDHALLRRLTKSGGSAEQGNPLIARIITIYITLVLLLGLAGSTWWYLSTGDAARALQVAVSLFVVSCPCALGVALPLGERIAASRAARHGAYPRKPNFWGRLSKVRKAVFDKTGTLTLGRPILTDAAPLSELDSEALSALARLTESSPHPVSRALSEELAARRVNAHNFENCAVSEVPGQGVSLTHQDTTWTLERDDRALADAALTCDGQTLARFHFRDQLRQGAGEEVAALRAAGISCYLMSGDRQEKVAAIASKLGLSPDSCRARMTPDEKAAWVRELDCQDTLYLGDGANDSLAFDEAYCSATPATELGLLQDKADLYFLGRGLAWLGAVLHIAHLRRRAIRRVVAFALLYNIAAASLALSGMMNPLIAAIIMPLSSAATIGIVTSALGHPRTSRQTAEEQRRHFQLKPRSTSPLLRCGVEQSGSSSGS